MLIRRAVTLRRIPAGDYPPHFFEVELDGIVRLRNDALLSGPAIANYLSQVAPLAFAPGFPFTTEIRKALEADVRLDTLNLTISGIDGPIYRPHRAGFSDDKRKAHFSEVELFKLSDVDGGTAAVGWVAHHEYDGAIPVGTGCKGVRLRVGNVQIGGTNLLENLFTEARFNSWSVGEVHVLDRRIVPNARRDDFEQNTHYANLLNQLTPVARAISKRCRTSSKSRQLLRDFSVQEQMAKERLQIIAQGGIRKEARKIQSAHIERALAKMTRISEASELESEKSSLISRTAKLRHRLDAASHAQLSTPLDLLPPPKRRAYAELLELIYECSANRSAAKALIDRIFEKITSAASPVRSTKRPSKRQTPRKK